MIRWTGSDFQGYDGSTWESFTDTSSNSGWTDSGGTVYLTTSSDNVGIATTTATSKLTVNGTVEITNASASVTGPKFKITPEGGYAIEMTNRNGSSVSKGMVVCSSKSYDFSFELSGVNSIDAVGVVYDPTISSGSDGYIVVSGIADVMLKNSTASTHGNFVYASDTAGRALADSVSPPSTTEHWRELGHCIESKSSGTNVVAKCVLHFN